MDDSDQIYLYLGISLKKIAANESNELEKSFQ